MNIDKSYIKSKTLWSAVALAVLPIFPEVQSFIKEKPELCAQVVAGIFFVLRIVTKGKLAFLEDKKE